MPVVRHGSMDLHWCRECDIPVMRRGPCPECGVKLSGVKYTPPGDIRPGFPHDMEEIKKLADDQWGSGAGEGLSLENGPVLLNPCPAPDRLDEVISGGAVIGSVQFSSLHLHSSFILREEGGQRLVSSGFKPERGYVVSDPSAVPFLVDGKNLLSPGIVDCSPGIEPGDEVLIVDPDFKILGSGTSRKKSDEMAGTRGMGVKVRWAAELKPGSGPTAPEKEWKEIWDKTVDLNSPVIGSKVKGSVNFIKRIVSEEDLPVAVSYSGGKDSLATLLLVMDAGLKPPLMFIDTGLEFPETVRHVHDLAEELDLELLEGKPENGFYDNIDRFGPPGRDFRWCCKTCKLGPTSSLIREHFPDGVLTFIGQRRFESDSRERKGSVWRNPWVPMQKGASPVQDWTALDIWLYILSKGVNYNPLYANGFQRIGCWLCPSCDLAETSLVRETEVDTSLWKEYLEKHRVESGLPREWMEHGFHRFKRPPPHMKKLAEELGLKDELFKTGKKSGSAALIDLVDGFGSCVDGISQEGILADRLDHVRLKMMANILGKVSDIDGTGGFEVRPESWKMKRAALEAYPDGTIVIRATDQESLLELRKGLLSILKRTDGCIGCMICAGRCPAGSIQRDEEGKISIDPHTCMHCGACLGPCPAEAFIEDPYKH